MINNHNHPFWSFLDSALMRSVLAVVLFTGMMLWIAWHLYATVWMEGNRDMLTSQSGSTGEPVEAEKAQVETEPDNESPVNWSGKTVIAEGPARQGPWRMNESEFLFVDDPSVALFEDGPAALVWANQSVKDIFFQIHTPDDNVQPDEPVNISNSPDIFSWLPRVVISPRNPDHIYLLWQEIIFSGGSHGGEILFARSVDGGQSFSDPVNLSNTTAGAGKGRLTSLRWDNGSLDIAVGPDETVHAVWTEYEGSLRYSRSTNLGETFSNPVTIAGDNRGGPARGPSLAISPGGNVYLAWTVGENRAADIHITRSTDGGQHFEPPRMVMETDGHSEAPRLIADPQGTLHLVHAESPEGMFRHYHIRYTQLSPPETGEQNGITAYEFTDPAIISVPHPDERFESANYPVIVTDGEGHLYVTWELFPDHWGRSQGLGFTASFDGGRSFMTPSRVPGTGDPGEGYNGSRQGLLMNKLDVNQAGSIAIVNSTFLEDEASRIRLIRGHKEMD